MGGTELKTDSALRWMIYSKDAYGSGRVFLTTEQKQAAEEGKKFAQRAYADVWAKDAALVQRVRSFLGSNFHWHQRLAQNGADLEVIQTLQSMVRGESVVLVAEQSRAAGGARITTAKPAALPSFRDSLMTGSGMSYDAATDYMERYNVSIDKINAALAQSASRAASARADDVGDVTDTTIESTGDGATDVGSDLDSDTDISTPLGDAQPFEYMPDQVDGDSFDVAKTPNLGEPGTWYTNPGSGQMRLYGDNGKPAIDLDFDHIHNGLQPHAHNWSNGVRDGGDDVVPFSPWSP